MVVDDLTRAQGEAVEAHCRERGAWPVRLRVSAHGLFRRRDRLELVLRVVVDGQHLLSDDAQWDAGAWSMQPHLLDPLADAVLVLVEDLPQGFTMRAT